MTGVLVTLAFFAAFFGYTYLLAFIGKRTKGD